MSPYTSLTKLVCCLIHSLLNLAMELLRANYAFFAQHFLTNNLLSRAFQNRQSSAMINLSKAPNTWSDDVISFFENGKGNSEQIMAIHFLETENVYLNRVFNIRLVIFFCYILRALLCRQ